MSVQEIVNSKIKEQLDDALQRFEGEIVEHQLTMDDDGAVVPWSCIRRSIDVDVQNGVSGYKYKGINKWLQSFDNENFYFTFKKIGELNGKLKKGSKCRYLFAYVPPKFEEDDQGDKKCVRGSFMRYHKVFRWQDTEGLERPTVTEDKNNSRAKTVEEFLDKVTKKGFKWTEAGNTVGYDEDEDVIHIPPLSRFESSDLYYATLFREIVKVTGHKDRLDRWKDKRHSESREELIGEVVSATICLRYGIDIVPETAGEVHKWIQALDSDNDLFTRAMSKAEKVLEYLDK